MKTCIITGGNGFLGEKFCKFFLKKNYKVLNFDINIKKNNKFKKLKNIEIYNIDITNEQAVKKVYKLLKNKKINCLINNAAIDAVPNNKLKKNLKYPQVKDWLQEFSVSILGSFLMIKYIGKIMSKNKSGSIINIGSDLSILAPNQEIYKNSYKNYYKPPTYSVLKHALLGLTKYYSSLLAKDGVSVNMISPGPIKNKQNKKLIAELINQIPSKQLGKPENLFGLLELLSSEQSRYITGQNILVDGGRSII